MKISIVVPVYNEEKNLVIFLSQLCQVLRRRQVEEEIIFVNDGSIDGSRAVLVKMAVLDKKIKVINFRKNFGQTAALSAGIKFSSGDVIIPMDSDLQNDPEDIWPMVDMLEEGYDLVSGWRKKRRDGLFLRRIPSWVANAIISWVSGVKLHDYGCTMKAYRRDVLANVNLYGEMHRFIPIYAKQYGAKIVEMEVHHHSRRYGKSKYGIGRVVKVMLDLLTVKFLNGYYTKPMHFFGGIGAISFVIGLVCFAFAFYLKLFKAISLIQTPLPLAGVFFCLISIQLVLMGLLAEMIMRNYYESQEKPTYLIKEKINL